MNNLYRELTPVTEAAWDEISVPRRRIRRADLQEALTFLCYTAEASVALTK